jgi:hypothetical protein
MSTATMPMYRWDDLPWKKFRKVVWKLQKRIYQAMLGTFDRRPVIEEPCEAKVSRTVLKPSGGGDSAA